MHINNLVKELFGAICVSPCLCPVQNTEYIVTHRINDRHKYSTYRTHYTCGIDQKNSL